MPVTAFICWLTIRKITGRHKALIVYMHHSSVEDSFLIISTIFCSVGPLDVDLLAEYLSLVKVITTGKSGRVTILT